MATVTLDGITRDVVVSRSGSGFVITVDGRRHEARDVALVENGVAFLLGHESHVARASAGAGGREVSVDGRVYRRERGDVDADRPAAFAGRAADGRLEAPMPGSIIAVNVAEGDRVRSGQPLVVLESMKMHNEIASPVDGLVRKVHCRVGEQVSFGHVLVEIGREGAP
jgi:biotin carboxyl carrier protein